jgi:acyl carrier protein
LGAALERTAALSARAPSSARHPCTPHRAKTPAQPAQLGGSAREEIIMATTEVISAWLINYLAKVLDVPASEIDPDTSFGEYGIDSAGAAGLSEDLGQWLGIKLKDSIAFEHPSIAELSKYLSNVDESSISP